MTAQDGHHDYGGDKPTIKIRLEEDDFNALVRGEVLKKRDLLSNRTIEILLADIGYTTMLKCFAKAIQNVRPQKRVGEEFPYLCDCGKKWKTIEEFIECRKNHPKQTPPNKT